MTELILCCLYVLSLGLKASLERMQLEYVDVVFANRPDPNTPMEGKHDCWNTIYPVCLLSVFVLFFYMQHGYVCHNSLNLIYFYTLLSLFLIILNLFM